MVYLGPLDSVYVEGEYASLPSGNAYLLEDSRLVTENSMRPLALWECLYCLRANFSNRTDCGGCNAPRMLQHYQESNMPSLRKLIRKSAGLEGKHEKYR